MTVDLRAIVACDLGHLISGDVGGNHISDRSGLVMTSGRLTIEGLISPARGTVVNLLVGCPQLNRVTRFPKVLRVIRATPYPLDNRTEVEVGCVLTLMKERKDEDNYFATGTNPLSAQALLAFCLEKIGVTLATGTRSLLRSYLISKVDLSQGYVQIIGDLIRSEECFGRLRPDDKLEIIPLVFSKGSAGPLLTAADIVSIEPINGGQDPPDQFIVRYNAAERQPGDATEPTLPTDFWSYNRTAAFASSVIVRYTTIDGQELVTSYDASTYSVNITSYRLIEYTDASGKQQKTDVAIYKVDRRLSPLAAVNSSYMSSLLRYGLAADFSTLCESLDKTWYEYDITSDGPVLKREETWHIVTPMEFAGGMSVPDYVQLVAGISNPIVYYSPGTSGAIVVTTKTITEHETVTTDLGNGLTRTKTRTKTSRYLSRGMTQTGQQEFAWAIKGLPSYDSIPGLVDAYKTLRLESVEVAVSEGKPAIPTRPLAQEAIAADISGGTTTGKTVTGQIYFTADMPAVDSIITTASYDMPYCPDDISNPGTGQQAALSFGRTEAALDVGHAYGYNIVTSFDRIPTPELAPIYIRLGGIEVAFLTDSLSYAFDTSGMVVSTDLMLLGVTGYYGATPPTSSWIRLASLPSALPAAAAPSTNQVSSKANSIAYPSGGIDPRNTAATFASLGSTGVDVFGTYQNDPNLIGPSQPLEIIAIASGPTVDFVDFDYALNAGTDVEYLAAGPVADFRWVEIITVPAAPVTVGARVPVVATGASVVVPASAVSIAAKVPTVGTGASVAVPVASVTIAAVAPAIGNQLVTVVPAASVTISAKVPASIGPQVDNYWSDWASQLYGFDRDWQPDWWVD